MIVIRSNREINLIRESSRIVAEALKIVEEMLEPGLRIIEIDKVIEKYICSKGAKPAFKGFKGYPASICASIDEQVVHGIPDKRILKTGQIISVDIGVELNDYFGDAAKTFAIGEIASDKARLMKITNEALYKGIEKAIAKNRLSDISNAIQVYVENAGYSIVRTLVGHGIGRDLHEEPQIPNFGKPNRGPRLKDGMVLAIEPMVNLGKHEVITADDNWTVFTSDGSPSAHFEHTIVVTKDGPEILTKL